MTGGFSNFLRETDDRTIKNKVMSGLVVNNADPNKTQRVTVRVHDLHDDIEDGDLPWFGPAQLSAASGSANVGDHGPIPEAGAKVWVMFGDASQYHATYGGGVATTQNQIPEFAGTSTTPVTMPGGQSYNFGDNYPSSTGGVDTSGSLRAVDSKTDVTTDQHVSGTGSSLDGMGNHAFTVNGGVARPDNPNAKAVNPTGGTYAIFGDCTLYVSGKLTVASVGDLAITSGGNLTFSCVGDMLVESNGRMDVTTSSTSKPMNLVAKYKTFLNTPILVSNPGQAAATGVDNDAATVAAPATQTAPAARTRPNIPITANQTSY